MRLRRTYTQSPIVAQSHQRKTSTWSEQHIELSPQPEIQDFISYMLSKQRDCICLKQCIKRESQKNQKLLERLKSKRHECEGCRSELQSLKLKNSAFLEQIRQNQQKIEKEIRNYGIQTAVLEETKDKRRVAADRLFCLREAYRIQKESGEAPGIIERRQSIKLIGEENKRIKQKIAMLEEQRDEIVNKKKQIEEMEEKRQIDTKVLASLKLIYDDIMKSLSQGEMKSQLIGDEHYLRMQNSIKNKCDIIKMGLQTHTEVNNFRRSVERYKEYEGIEIMYTGLEEEEEKEMMETQEYEFYSQTASSCKELNSMKIDEVEEALKMKNISKSKTKQIDSIRVNSAKAIEDSKRMDEQIKKKDAILDELRQKLSSIRV